MTAAAYVVKHHRDFPTGPILVWDTSRAQSPEAAFVSQKLEEVARRVQESAVFRKAAVKAIMENVRYASLPYIARKTNLNAEEAARILESDPAFRKSFFKTKSGQDVYMLNSSLSWLRDAWSVFRYINSMKY